MVVVLVPEVPSNILGTIMGCANGILDDDGLAIAMVSMTVVALRHILAAMTVAIMTTP